MQAIIHIGFPKTGTSSLQYFLNHFRDVLLNDYNILYPKNGLLEPEGHHLLSSLFSPEHDYFYRKYKDRKEEILKNLIDEIKGSSCNTVFFSSEAFSAYNFDHLARFLEFINSHFNLEGIDIVAYIRRQDQYLESIYKQEIRNYHTRLTSFIDDFTVLVKHFVDYWRIFYLLQKKLSNIKNSNLKIFIYDRKSFKNNNIICDFLSKVFGIDLESPGGSGLNLEDFEINKSLSVESTLALRSINEELDLPEEIHSSICGYLYRLDSERRSKLKFLLPLEDRINLLKWYEQSNKKFFEKYLKTDNLFVLNEEQIRYFKEYEKYIKANEHKIHCEVKRRIELIKDFVRERTEVSYISKREFIITEFGWRGLFGKVDGIDHEGIKGWLLDLKGEKPCEVMLKIDEFIIADSPERRKLSKEVARLYEYKGDPMAAFCFKWENMELSSEFIEYLNILPDDYSLKIKVIEKATGKAIARNYTEISAKDLKEVFQKKYSSRALIKIPDLKPVFSISDKNGFEYYWSLFKDYFEETLKYYKVIFLRGYTPQSYCIACNAFSDFKIKQAKLLETETNIYPIFREHLICTNCRLNTRLRLVLYYLKYLVRNLNFMHGKPRIYVLENSTQFAKECLKQLNMYAHLTFSEFFGLEYKSGTFINGVLHQDVCDLSFHDNYFDIIVSNDVFEHTYDFKKAFAECYRVLKPGGHLVFTVPFSINRDRSIIRAKLVNEELIYLEEPIYHGDPIRKFGSLVFADFGWDLLDFLKQLGFRVELLYFFSPTFLILHGPASFLWVAHKLE